MKQIVDKVINEYAIARTQIFTGHPLGVFFRKEIPRRIYNTGIVDERTHLITGSTGQGGWVDSAWFAIFDRRITTSARKGVYIVYLLSNDGSTLYITLNQGCESIRANNSKKETVFIMRKQAQKIISKIDTKHFKTDENINLGMDLTERAEMYQKGTICYKAYKRGEVPSEDELRNDLTKMMAIYDEYFKVFEENCWWPLKEEYDPEISEEKWLEMLRIGVFYPGALSMMAKMVAFNGSATCSQLAKKYGNIPQHYSMTAIKTSKNVQKYTGCKIFVDNTGKEHWWTILFVGKEQNYLGEGVWVWKLREELLAALKKFEINKYLNKIGKFFSWEIIDEITAIKSCDKSFFEDNGSGIPKEICWFFDAEDIPAGETQSVQLIFGEKEYSGRLSNDSTDRRRMRIHWQSDLGRNFNLYKDKNVVAKFVKIDSAKYEITMEETKVATILDNIILALKKIGGKGRYSDIYAAYEEISGLEMTDSRKAGIRGTIERFSSDSDVYEGKGDLFYSVEGKGRGVWGLRGYSSDFDDDKIVPIKTEMIIKEKIQNIKSYIAAKGFNYEGQLIENFYLSLKSKPFVILAGTSGTGKTKLVKLFAEAIGAEMKLVPVRPDWSDSSDLFGHVDLAGNFKAGAIIDFVKQAELDKDKPYFLCLDEMNLARVEYYLSDFLSIIETRDRVNGEIITDPLVSEEYYQNERAKDKYGKLIIPENLYIIGTVNMDETTFPFSKKVLDRANTIEFSFVNFTPKKQIISPVETLKLDNTFLKTKYLYFNEIEDDDFKSDISFKLEELNNILSTANLHVGYRVRDEIAFYMMNNKESELLEENIAFDNEIMQKILPRIQGSSGAIKQLLCDLFVLCAGDYSGFTGNSIYEQMSSHVAKKDCKYPNTAKKIVFMMRRYEEDGFTSYWL